MPKWLQDLAGRYFRYPVTTYLFWLVMQLSFLSHRLVIVAIDTGCVLETKFGKNWSK